VDNFSGYVKDTFAKLSDKFDLRWRSHRMRVSLPPAAGSVPASQPIFNLPTKWPFAVAHVIFVSDRDDDRRIVSFTGGTSQVKFVAEPTKLAAYGWPQGGSSPTDIPIAILVSEDRVEFTLIRDRAPNPADTYPDPKEDSTIDIVLLGAELMHKGSSTDAER